MSFHVQIGQSFHRASVFNLSEAQIRRQVLEPWSRGQTVVLGDREWDPAESTVVVLEGPSLDASELALGQGWHAASKKGRDVTATLLAESSERASGPAAVAVLADAEPALRAMESLLADLGLRAAEWGSVQTRLLASEPAGVAAAIIVLGPNLGHGRPHDEAEAHGRRAFEIGLAVGALGHRLILAEVEGGAVPAGLEDLAAIRLDPGSQAPLHALAERLRLMGCDVCPTPGWDEPKRFAFL